MDEFSDYIQPIHFLDIKWWPLVSVIDLYGGTYDHNNIQANPYNPYGH